MTYVNTPRFAWTGGTWTPRLPARFWTPGEDVVGGVRVAASGVPASYIVDRRQVLEVPVRFWENEWTDAQALVAFGQSAQAFTYFPDSLEPENFQVYLDEPAPGKRWNPTRTEFPRVFEIVLTLRGAGSTPWVPFFP